MSENFAFAISTHVKHTRDFSALHGRTDNVIKAPCQSGLMHASQRLLYVGLW
jgi:hypothetical protein